MTKIGGLFMNYSIIYSSKTGNTKQLANIVQETLTELYPDAVCLSCCAAEDAPEDALTADRVYVGFWTDKGTCDADTAAFLGRLHDTTLFLFGTAGFGASSEYYKTILDNVRKNIAAGNTVAGTFMCQGRMPAAVRTRYEKMAEADPDNAQMKQLIQNFDKALAHPDETDFNELRKALRAWIASVH